MGNLAVPNACIPSNVTVDKPTLLESTQLMGCPPRDPAQTVPVHPGPMPAPPTDSFKWAMPMLEAGWTCQSVTVMRKTFSGVNSGHPK